jgi:hypothetical protein
MSTEQQEPIEGQEEKGPVVHRSVVMSEAELEKLIGGDTVQLGNPELPHFEIRWLEAAESPFGARLFDCREYAIHHFSTTADNAVAERFLNSRATDGKEYFGQFPDDATGLMVDLQFPFGPNPAFAEGIPDGPVFKAQSMDEKWDIYKYENHFLFVRSWTGELVYVTNYEAVEGGFKIERFILDGSSVESEADAHFEVRIVQYLVYSHVLGIVFPHPVPKALEDDPEKILSYSFAQFGNRGYFGACDA